MPTVKVEKSCGLSQQEAFNRVKHLLENDKDLRKMDPSCQFSFNEGASTGSAKGSMFSAEMKVSAGAANAGAATTVVIEVQLPIMLSMAKGMVQSTLDKKLTAALSA